MENTELPKLMLSNYVLVRRDDKEAVTSGGIIIPDASQQRNGLGTVLMVGAQVSEVSVGDRVKFPPNHSQVIVIDKEELLCIRETYIDFIITENEKNN